MGGGGDNDDDWTDHPEGDGSQKETPPDENPGKSIYDMPGPQPGLQIRIPEKKEHERPPRTDIPNREKKPVWN